jgi:hypothetical protein
MYLLLKLYELLCSVLAHGRDLIYLIIIEAFCEVLPNIYFNYKFSHSFGIRSNTEK